MFPTANSENQVIGVLDVGSPAGFTVFCSSHVPDDKLVGAGNAMQFFPRYVYDAPDDNADQTGLFQSDSRRRHNVTEDALRTYRELDSNIDRDDPVF